MRIGRIPVAAGLIIYGTALLLDNVGVTAAAVSTVLRLWPLLLIATGLEYLWAARSEGREVRFDVAGALLLVAIILLSSAGRFLPALSFSGFSAFAPFNGPTRLVTTAAASEGVQELRVRTDVGRIQLYPGSGGIQVEATLVSADRSDNLENVQVRVRPGEVAEIYLEGLKPGQRVAASYRITAPQDLRVKLDTGTGSVETSGYHGDLSLSSQTGRTAVEEGAGSLTIGGGTGSITVNRFSGPVRAATTTGSITATNATGNLTLESGTGSVKAIGFQGGALQVRTRIGSIRAETDKPLDGNVRLETGTGSITLQFPKSSSVQLQARTSTGGMNAPSWVTQSRSGPSRTGSGRSGDGKYQVELQTSNGSITLRHW